METASAGRLDVTLYPPGQLIPTAEQLEAVYAGAVDMVHTTPPYFRGRIPVTDVEYALPLDFEHPTQKEIFFYEYGFKEFMDKIYAEQGIYFLGAGFGSGLDFLSSKPVNSLDDWRGIMTRTFGASADLLDAVGVPTTYIPGGELYMGLKLGTVDAYAFGSIGNGHEQGFTEVT